MRVRKCHTVLTNTKYHSDLSVNLQSLEIPNLSLLSVCPSHRVWKGIFGIRDLTKLRCGNRENDKNIDGIPGFDCFPGNETRLKLGTGCGIYVCARRNVGNCHDSSVLAAKKKKPGEC